MGGIIYIIVLLFEKLDMPDRPTPTSATSIGK